MLQLVCSYHPPLQALESLTPSDQFDSMDARSAGLHHRGSQTRVDDADTLDQLDPSVNDRTTCQRCAAKSVLREQTSRLSAACFAEGAAAPHGRGASDVREELHHERIKQLSNRCCMPRVCLDFSEQHSLVPRRMPTARGKKPPENSTVRVERAGPSQPCCGRALRNVQNWLSGVASHIEAPQSKRPLNASKESHIRAGCKMPLFVLLYCLKNSR